jgi:hypothetical protein
LLYHHASIPDVVLCETVIILHGTEYAGLTAVLLGRAAISGTSFKHMGRMPPG